MQIKIDDEDGQDWSCVTIDESTKKSKNSNQTRPCTSPSPCGLNQWLNKKFLIKSYY